MYYGAGIADAQAAGFNELPMPATEMVRLGGSRLELHAGLLRCRRIAIAAPAMLRADDRCQGLCTATDRGGYPSAIARVHSRLPSLVLHAGG